MEVDEIDAIDQYPFSLSSQNLSNSMTSAPEEEDDNALMDLTAVKAGFFLAYVLVFFFCVFGNSLILLVIIGNRFAYFVPPNLFILSQIHANRYEFFSGKFGNCWSISGHILRLSKCMFVLLL